MLLIEKRFGAACSTIERDVAFNDAGEVFMALSKKLILAWVGALGLLALSPVPALGGAASSPDRRYEAYVQQVGPGDETVLGDQALILVDKRTGAQRVLLRSRFDDDHTRNLSGLSTPIFSLNGGFLYISASDTSPFRASVHQIDIKTGQARFVTTGWGLSLLRTGPYRGYLLVQTHELRGPRGGTYNPVYVVRPDGHREMVVPGSKNQDGQLAVGPWLQAKGWHAW